MDAGTAPRYVLWSLRRLLALLVSLMLLLPAGSVSAQAFFCHMRGQLTSKCCCGDRASEEEAPGGPSAGQGDCCDSRTLSASGERRGVSASDDLPGVPPAVVLAVLPTVELATLPAERGASEARRARAPPRPASAPLFILHRAFLS